jgi:uncharacterized RDD family membrane protein YckC
MFCRNCGKEISNEAVICIHCGNSPKNGKNFCHNCGSVIEPKTEICMNCGVRSTNIVYAGFWKRFMAIMIDVIVLMPFNLVSYFTLAFPYIYQEDGNLANLFLYEVISIFIPWFYFALMESSKYQATVGKMALGIIVTDLERNRISYGKATGRHFGKIISSIILCIGFLMAGYTQKKQALHDIMAGCLVIMKNQ